MRDSASGGAPAKPAEKSGGDDTTIWGESE